MDLRWIPHLSPAYALAVALRRDILRKPLGLEYSEGQLDAESGEAHLACFEGDVLIGTLILRPLDPQTVQMRQVAVQDRRQGQGIGRLLVGEFEQEARRRGCTRAILHARATAVPFYETLGYTLVGEPYEEVGLPHRSMEKNL